MKIVGFKDAPLKRVLLHMNFKEEIHLPVSEAAKVTEILSESFSIEPNLVLLPPPTPNQTMQVTLSGGLKYEDEEENSLFIGKNFLVFDIREYSDWEELLNLITTVIVGLKSILNIKNIDNLVLTYIDEFKIDTEGFNFEDYFNLSISLKKSEHEDREIDYRDFFLGLVPYWDDTSKIVLRLKGRGIVEQEYHFSLETVCKYSQTIEIEEETLRFDLTNIHGKIESYFISLLYKTELAKNLGMLIEDE